MAGIPFSIYRNPNEPPHGYPQVATHMSNHPEMAMYRRFRSLNSRNLLYLQAELVIIEKKLLKLEREDAGSHDEQRKNYSRDYEYISMSAEDDDKNEQYKLILEMRSKLNEYNDVLIQQSTLASVTDPSKYDVKTIQDWFCRGDLGGAPLTGDDCSILGRPDKIENNKRSQHVPDLVAINGRSDDIDRVTNWIADKVVPYYDYRLRDKKALSSDGMAVYRESKLKDFTSILATVLASMLPIVGIVVLYVVHDPSARLGIIAGFTAFFSLALTLITNAERVENFAATAAFAAVMVVFVGSNPPSAS